jgi:hypothetical protein
MPPVPPGNRSNKGPASRPNTVSKEKSLKDEHHPNAAEEGETANVKQNTTNKGFFRGRRYEKWSLAVQFSNSEFAITLDFDRMKRRLGGFRNRQWS